MVFVGLGIGVAMPIMNIAVQNEFEQKDLGAATSASQLFRSLGSTIGTAVFGSLLTIGVAASLGDMKNDPYIQTLRQSPEASQIVTDTADPNVLLRINTASVSSAITTGFESAIIDLPDGARADALSTFEANQANFSKKIVDAFSDSIHTIFAVAASVVAVATILVFALRERPLAAAKSTDTPISH